MTLMSAQSAAKELQRVAPTAGRTADAWVAVGEAWLGWGRARLGPEDAGIALYARGAAVAALGAAPQHRPAQRLLARAQLTGHDFRAAYDTAVALTAACDAAIASGDDDDDDRADCALAHAIAADAAIELGALTDVDAHLVVVARDAPDLAPIRRAYLAYLRGDVQTALAGAERAASPRAPYEAAFFDADLALYALAAGDVDAALALSARALTVLGDHPPLLVTRARAVLAQQVDATSTSGHGPGASPSRLAEAREALSRAFLRVSSLEASELLVSTDGLLNADEAALLVRDTEGRVEGRERAWWIAVHAPTRIAEARRLVDDELARRRDVHTRAIAAVVAGVEAATDPRARAVADDLIAGLGPIAAVDPLTKTLVMRARTPPQ